MGDNITPMFPREVRLDGLRKPTGEPIPADLIFPRLPKDERARLRQEVLERIALLEAELKSIKHLIEMDDL